MKEESVSVREFERWASFQAEIQNKHSQQLEKISEEIRDTNTLLRGDIAVTKQMIETHTIQYNSDKKKDSETFSKQNKRLDNIEETLKEREGVYNIAEKIKWAIVIIITGSLAAFGKDIVSLVL